MGPGADPHDDVFEVMQTCRAMRWLRPDPVPSALVDRVLWAATRAPSPGNSQQWAFVVVDDPGTLQRIADAIQPTIGATAAPASVADASVRLMLEGAVNLMTNLADVPVIVFVCGPVAYPAGQPDEFFTWSALLPAAQNLLLAARALGLGTAFTALHRRAEPAVRAILGLPDEIRIGATIPMGWPASDFGPVRRRDMAEVVHRNSWGALEPQRPVPSL
jgi:nitroreductase